MQEKFKKHDTDSVGEILLSIVLQMAIPNQSQRKVCSVYPFYKLQQGDYHNFKFTKYCSAGIINGADIIGTIRGVRYENKVF